VLIDTHCHLYFEDFDADREAVIARMAEAGVAGAVVAAVDAESCAQARALAGQHACLRYAAGLHPAYAVQQEYWRGGVFDAQAFLAPWWEAEPAPVAVGECGMDLHWKVNPLEVQHAVFTAQLAFARERGLPVIVHTRDADVETREALEAVPGARGVFHCFSGSALLLDFALRERWYVSFAGNLTYPKAHALREAARQVPPERLLVETDAPFLAPQAHRGRRCEPALVAHTARTLAGLRGLAEPEMAALLRENAQRCFSTRWA
jgi:TatD DNase family protein